MGKKRSLQDCDSPVIDRHVIGHELSIYKIKDTKETGRWISCDSNTRGRLQDSIIEKYIREGGSLTGSLSNKRQRIANSSEFAKAASQRHDEARDENKSKSHQQYVQVLAKIENFMQV